MQDDDEWPFGGWNPPRAVYAADPCNYARLYTGETLLGTLLLRGVDDPRRYYELAPTAAFEAVRAVFEDFERDRNPHRLSARCEPLDLRVVHRLPSLAGRVQTERVCALMVFHGDRVVIRKAYARFPDDRERLSEDDDPDPSWSPPISARATGRGRSLRAGRSPGSTG